MNNSAPKELGILAIAALFGLIALLVSWLVLSFGGFASFLIGVLVAIITAIVLWFGWREPADGSSGPRDLTAKPAERQASTAAAPSASTATATAAPAMATPAPAPTPAPVATPVEPAPVVKPAAKPAPAAKAAAPVAKAAPAPKASPAPKRAAKAKPAAKPIAADGKPEMLSKPRGGTGDDLKLIKGVGPKLEKMVNTMGVWHFDQVASWRKKEVAWVDENLEGFKGRVSRDEWVKQAKVLAKGGATEFSKKAKKSSAK